MVENNINKITRNVITNWQGQNYFIIFKPLIIYYLRVLFFLMLLIPLASSAKEQYKYICGKWEEQSRTKGWWRKINFSDTLRIDLHTDGFMLIRHNEGATITGTGKIFDKKVKLYEANNVLKFTIVS